MIWEKKTCSTETVTKMHYRLNAFMSAGDKKRRQIIKNDLCSTAFQFCVYGANGFRMVFKYLKKAIAYFNNRMSLIADRVSARSPSTIEMRQLPSNPAYEKTDIELNDRTEISAIIDATSHSMTVYIDYHNVWFEYYSIFRMEEIKYGGFLSIIPSLSSFLCLSNDL